MNPNLIRTVRTTNVRKLVTATAVALGALVTGIASAAGPTVDGNVISWTEEGWHQVQVQGTYESICGGGRQCTVPNGVYTVINHGTGERFKDILVLGATPGSGNSTPAPVAASGQITSYNFGDDGDYQSGVATPESRFLNNGDGTVTDTLTNLVWLNIRECLVRHDWAGAVNYANSLYSGSDNCPELNDGSVAGDWRLPNVKELYSLVDISQNSPVWAEGIAASMVGSFTSDPYGFYWSSSSFHVGPDILGWAVDGGFGEVDVLSKGNTELAWAIRENR